LNGTESAIQRFTLTINSKFAIIAAALAVTANANATTFNYDYTTTAGDSADLTLTATAFQPGEFQITDITGERDGSVVTGFQSGGPSTLLSSDGLWDYNNVLYTSGNPFDYYGIVYTTSAGEFNIFNNSPMVEYGSANGQYTGANDIVSSNFTSSTPGPAALAPFAVGLIGLVRRRKA
jgi:MYXO-CTERM domain-containing protein